MSIPGLGSRFFYVVGKQIHFFFQQNLQKYPNGQRQLSPINHNYTTSGRFKSYRSGRSRVILQYFDDFYHIWQ